MPGVYWTTGELARCKAAYAAGGIKAAVLASNGRTENAMQHRAVNEGWVQDQPLSGEQVVAWAETLPPDTYFTNRQVFDKVGGESQSSVNSLLNRLLQKGRLRRRLVRGYANRYEYTIHGE